jgi:hypothetical protein
MIEARAPEMQEEKRKRAIRGETCNEETTRMCKNDVKTVLQTGRRRAEGINVAQNRKRAGGVF